MHRPNIPLLVDLLTTSNIIYLFLGVLVIIMLLTAGIAFVWNVMKLSGNRFDFWLAYALLIPYSVITINTVKWSSFTSGAELCSHEARLKYHYQHHPDLTFYYTSVVEIKTCCAYFGNVA